MQEDGAAVEWKWKEGRMQNNCAAAWNYGANPASTRGSGGKRTKKKDEL